VTDRGLGREPYERFIMMRVLCLVLLLHAGCARRAAVDAQPSVEPRETPSPGAESQAAPEDLGDLAVERAAAPDTPALPPIEQFVAAPRPRTLSAWLVDPESTQRLKLVPSPFFATRPIVARPAPPAEGVPSDLGAGAQGVPAKPKLPVAAAATKRSRDVNVPPPLPHLGRSVSDRVGFDDPTADFGTAVITNPPLKTPFAPAPFLKVTVPDPFALGEQIRPSIPPGAEPGLTPVPVNPRRPK